MAAFEIRHIDANKGLRAMFATQDIKIGDTIFEEKPLVCSQFLWNECYGYCSCDHCLRPLESAQENARRLTGNESLVLPFAECCATLKPNHCQCQYCGIAYCSDKCRADAWNQYHRSLCPSYMAANGQPIKAKLDELTNTWKQMHYPPEAASILLALKILATIKQANDKEAVIKLFSQFRHNSIVESKQIAHKLLGKQFDARLNVLRNLVSQTISDPAIEQCLTPEGFSSLVALIGMNGQGIETSPLSSWVHNCDRLDLVGQHRSTLDSFIDDLYKNVDQQVGTFIDNEGSGLYLLQSACNHSCVPNAEINFPNNDSTLAMEAIQDIKAGDEIVTCYLDEFDRHRSRHSRIKILRENHLFTCSCVKCESQRNEPDITSDEEEGEDEDDDDDDEEEGHQNDEMSDMICD